MQVEECKVVHSNSANRTIRVERVENNNAVPGEIKLFKGMAIPAVNSYVACVFDNGKGFVIGELE